VKKEGKEVKPKHNKIRLFLKHKMSGGDRHLGKIYTKKNAEYSRKQNK
jgi:hypothetical protein